MNIEDFNNVFFDDNILAESFQVTPPGGSAFEILGIWDNIDSPSGFEGIQISDDMPSVDFKSSDVSSKGIIKKSKVVRIKTGEIFYVLDQSPDIDGSITSKLTRDIPQ